MLSKLKIKIILMLVSIMFGVSAGPVVGDAIDNITPLPTRCYSTHLTMIG